MTEIVIDILQFIGGIILSIGYIPQLRQIIKTKSVKDLNITYLKSLVVGIGLMEIYAVYNIGVTLMFFVTNTISFILAVVMLVLFKIYEKSEEK